MSINKTVTFGYLGRDPEVSYTVTGKAVTRLNVATTEKWKDSQGQPQERTEWNRITFFDTQAETIGKSFKKGERIYVEGKLQTSQYEKNGETRYSTEIIGIFFQFIEKKQDQPVNQNTFVKQNNVPEAFPQQSQGGFNQQSQQSQQPQPGFFVKDPPQR